jgi:hypothetical protein
MGEKLAAGGGVLMFIASFLPWYKVTVEFLEFSESFTANGWDAPGAIWSILAVFIGLALVVAILGPKLANMQLPALGSITWGQAFAGLGGLSLLFIILKFLNESSSISYGFFLGIIAALAMAAGGYLLYTEEKGSSPFGNSTRA